MRAFLLLTLILFYTPAFALVEIRGSFGIGTPNPTELNNYLTSLGTTSVFITGITGVDVIVKPPSWPVGVGVRYQYHNIKVTRMGSGNASADLQANRVAALVDWRLIDSTFFLGLVGTVGFSTNTRLLTVSSGGTSLDYSDNKGTSFSIGAEYGFKLGPFMLGGEGGYQYFVASNLSSTSGNANFKIDLSGLYILGFLGLSI